MTYFINFNLSPPCGDSAYPFTFPNDLQNLWQLCHSFSPWINYSRIPRFACGNFTQL